MVNNQNKHIYEMQMVINEKHQHEEQLKSLIADYEKKIEEFDVHLHKKEGELKQRVQGNRKKRFFYILFDEMR